MIDNSDCMHWHLDQSVGITYIGFIKVNTVNCIYLLQIKWKQIWAINTYCISPFVERSKHVVLYVLNPGKLYIFWRGISLNFHFLELFEVNIWVYYCFQLKEIDSILRAEVNISSDATDDQCTSTFCRQYIDEWQHPY